MRVGILTGGGDCPGLNAVIRATTKSLIHQYCAEVIGIEDGFLGLIERRIRPLDVQSVSETIALGGTILGTHNRANPFQYFAANGADISDEVVAYVRSIGLDAMVVIGGDGTMSIAHRITQKGIFIVGCPKTIDNDLMHTDRTFGFDTAVSTVTEALDRLQTTAKSHGRVMILETMGRYAGWIALEAGVAGGADVILIPERPYQLEEVIRVCQKRAAQQKFTLIAMAEGATMRGGAMTFSPIQADSHDPLRLGGVAHVLREQLQPHLASEVRATVLGHVQRGGTPTAFDRILATQFGHAAAEMLAEGQFNRLVTLNSNRIDSVPLAEVAERVKTVPTDHPLLKAAWAMGVSTGEPV